MVQVMPVAVMRRDGGRGRGAPGRRRGLRCHPQPCQVSVIVNFPKYFNKLMNLLSGSSWIYTRTKVDTDTLNM